MPPQSTLSRYGIDIERFLKLNPNNVSAWIVKRLMRIIRHRALATLDESATKIKSDNEAKAAARRIMHNVVRPSTEYINLDDLKRFLTNGEVQKIMNLFIGAFDPQRITKSALESWLVKAFREWRALALSLDDTKTVVKTLHQMVNFIVPIVTVGVSLLIIGISTTTFLIFTSSQVVLMAFVFGNTFKTVFESVFFLFAIHMFDVGVICQIDQVELTVEEMNVLTTVFLRLPDRQVVMHQNSVFATKSIGNYRRSLDMRDVLEFCIQLSTPA